jgi:hypothetical protein
LDKVKDRLSVPIGRVDEMKKVYGCTPLLFVAMAILACLSILTFIVSKKPYFTNLPPALWLFNIVTVLGFLYFIRTLIVPVFAYDESGFIKLGILRISRKIHGWDEVKEIKYSAGGKDSTAYLVRFGDRGLFFISANNMMGHQKVLTDVVHYVLKNNPGANIDARVLEKVGKPDSWFDNATFIYAFFILAFFVVIGMIRFLKIFMAH